ncbi:hypothetical protein H8E88_31240 [candidate division KSB1 bacterium]|nr:hypothetical protein [candidate division KSB1 bacterium]
MNKIIRRGITMKVINILILFSIYVGQTVITAKTLELNKNIPLNELESIYKYGVNRKILVAEDGITVGGRKNIYFFPNEHDSSQSKTNSIIAENIHTVSLTQFGNFFISHSFNPNDGYLYLLIFIKNGEVVKGPVAHHPNTGRIFFNSKDTTIVVTGIHYTKYLDMLDKYDENSFNPSSFSKQGISNFFRMQTAYMLTKYDINLTLIDSANFIDRHGDDVEGFEILSLGNASDISQTGNIFTVHKSSNYLIRKYSPGFELLFEFEGTNENYKPIHNKLTEEKAERMRNVPGTFSNIYTIQVMGDKILTSFYQNPKNWDPPEPPFYYDIFNLSGEKVHSGAIPYRIFTRDNSGNLYTVIKKIDGWIIKKNRYYLVSFTIDDLISNRVNEIFMENKIKKYLEGK